MFFLALIFFFMLFSYKTISVLNYNEPIDVSQDQHFGIDQSVKDFVLSMSIVNAIFKEAVISGIVMLVALTFLFIGIAMTRENEKAG